MSLQSLKSIKKCSSLSLHEHSRIRPTYKAPDALPNAEKAEDYLRTHFLRLMRVATEAELEALLECGDVGMAHFAGHADGNTARLSLEGAKVPPTPSIGPVLYGI